MTWIAEHAVIWVLPSGERRPGRVAIGAPETIAASGEETGHAWCSYVLEGLGSAMAQPRRAGGADAFQALWQAMQMLGFWLYLSFADGVRVLYPEDSDADPESETASLISMLGPLVRDNVDDRGPADSKGRIAALEAKLKELRSKRDDEA